MSQKRRFDVFLGMSYADAKILLESMHDSIASYQELADNRRARGGSEKRASKDEHRADRMRDLARLLKKRMTKRTDR